MIPSSSIASMYAKIIGENSLIAMAQNNLLSNLERISKVRTHTFIANNGQTEFGISRNFGHERYYSWEDTLIDCRNSPSLISSEVLKEFDETLSENHRFNNFKLDLESRLNGLIEVKPFHSILYGEENMRYNIRRASKIEDFDIIRVGVHLSAKCDEDFKQGLSHLENLNNPLIIRTQLKQA